MSTPAGWYPQADGQQRYWDGQQWTEDFAPGAGQPAESVKAAAATVAARKTMKLQNLGSIGFKPLTFSFGIQQDCFAATRILGKAPSLSLFDLADMQPYKNADADVFLFGGREVYMAANSFTGRVAIGFIAFSSGFEPIPVPAGYNIGVCDFLSNESVRLQAPRAKYSGTKGTSMAAFSPSGRMLAAIRDFDSQVLLFDVDGALGSNRQTEPVGELRWKAKTEVSGMAWSPDGKWLALRSNTGLDLWRLPNGDDPGHLQSESVSFSTGGSSGSKSPSCAGEIVFSPDSEVVATTTAYFSHKVIRQYNLARQELVAESPKLKVKAMKLAFSTNGLRLFSGDDQGTVAEWRQENTDRPNLVMVESVSVGAKIIALDVDQREQVLLLASEARSKKGVDVYAATSSDSAFSAEEYAKRCVERSGERREALLEKHRVSEERKLRVKTASGAMNDMRTAMPPAGWFPDPVGGHHDRYWDGTRWTEQVADEGVVSIDHLPG